MTSMVNTVVIGPITTPTKEVPSTLLGTGIMGELRDRMVRDMELRNYALRTIESYVADVKGLARYYKRRPDKLTDQEVQRYLLHLREERRLSVSTCNQVHCALKFLYEVTLRRPQASLTVPRLRGEQKLPEILSQVEVGAIIAATRTQRDRVLLMLTYGGGLRLSEVTSLRHGDLDRDRLLIRVEQGKGNKACPELVEGTATRYCPRARSGIWSATTASTGSRVRGCSSRSAIHKSRWIPALHRRCTRRPSTARGSTSKAASTRCAMDLPLTCWKRVVICRACSACWGTAT
jgi:integrase